MDLTPLSPLFARGHAIAWRTGDIGGSLADAKPSSLHERTELVIPA